MRPMRFGCLLALLAWGLFHGMAAAAHAGPVAEALARLANEEDLPNRKLMAVTCASLNQLDRESAQLMRAMEWTTASTLGQALNAIGLRQAIDMDKPIVAVFDSQSHVQGFPAVALIPTRNGESFEAAVKAEAVDGNAAGLLAFEMLGRRLIARRLDTSTIAVGTDQRAMGRLIRSSRRDGAWLEGVPEAGVQAMEQRSLSVVCRRLSVWVSASDDMVRSVGMLNRPSVFTVTPGPLGLKLDAFIKGPGGDPGDDGKGLEVPGRFGDSLLEGLRRENAFMYGQLAVNNPVIQQELESLCKPRRQRGRATGSGAADAATDLLLPVPGASDDSAEPAMSIAQSLLETLTPVHRVAFVTALGSVEELAATTYLELARNTTVHWTSSDAEAQAHQVFERLAVIVAAHNKGQAPAVHFVAQPADAGDAGSWDDADGQRTRLSWKLQLPDGRLGTMNLNWLPRSPWALMLWPRSQPLSLSGDVTSRGEHGAATVQRPYSVAIRDHRAVAGDESIEADAVLKQVRSLLPGDRIAELYIEHRLLIEALVSLLDDEDQFPLPAVVPPTGMVLGIAGDDLHGGVFVPAIVLRPMRGLLKHLPPMQPAG